MKYPFTHKDNTVEILHGITIADPYRWLEDLDSSDTRQWIEAQNQLTRSYLEDIPAHPGITKRLTELWDFEKFTPPIKRSERYFFTYNDGLESQASLFWMDSLDGEPRLLLDPNTLTEDGTAALTGFSISDDGKILAYGISLAGSDWQEWRLRDVETAQELPDIIRWVKFSTAAWAPDNLGFYYSRYEQPEPGATFKDANRNQKLYFHRLGTLQEADELIYYRPDHPEWGFGADVTEDGLYLIISVWKGTHRENAIYYKDLSCAESQVQPILPDFDAAYTFIFNRNNQLYFLTDNNAPNSRLIAIQLDQLDYENWKEIIAESADALSSIHRIGNQLFAIYMHDAHHQVVTLNLSGKRLGKLDLPGFGSVLGFDGGSKVTEAFYSFSSFSYPGTIFRYDLQGGISSVFRQPKITFNPSEFTIQQVFYNSKDGTRIPMFLCHKPNLELDGNNHTLLYGYGGFNIPVLPAFSVAAIVWMEMGGIYAVANLRGGGEYGKAWHTAGMLHNKQNVFDDFISAAEWLIKNGYTCPQKLAISGRSNGGLLIGACMTQRPELFGACIAGVGVMDMLRFHKFTIGWAWVSDYGSPDDQEDFKTLLAYSPYHNLRTGTTYPATLIHTGDHDDRVFPAHSFKFAAALQAAQDGNKPVLIRIDTRAGHGMGKPTQKLIEETADLWAFLVKSLEITWE